MRILTFLIFTAFSFHAVAQENYLFPEFTQAQIYYKENMVPAELNYNLFTSYMMSVDKKNKLRNLERINEIEYISAGKYTFVPLKDNTFGVVVYDGDLILAIKYTGNIQKTEGDKSISKSALNKLLNAGEALPSGITIIKDSSYYFYKPRTGNKTFYLPGVNVEKANYIGIIKLFAKHKTEIDTFIREKEIDFSSFDHLKQLVQFCENFIE